MAQLAFVEEVVAMAVQCEHRSDGVRCPHEATVAIHDHLAMLLWACDEHTAPLLRVASARLKTGFVQVEVFKGPTVSADQSVDQSALWEMIA